LQAFYLREAATGALKDISSSPIFSVDMISKTFVTQTDSESNVGVYTIIYKVNIVGYEASAVRGDFNVTIVA